MLIMIPMVDSHRISIKKYIVVAVWIPVLQECKRQTSEIKTVYRII